MILIGLGANLDSRIGPPRATCEAALAMLAVAGVAVLRRSPWYRSAPVPPSGQPWFVNGVTIVATERDPVSLLALLHAVEADLGRVRTARNAARVIDLDLLAYNDLVREHPPILPHPRLHERAFVLKPLADIAPDWHHPRLGASIAELAARLPAAPDVAPLG